MKSYADTFFDKLHREKARRAALHFRLVVIVTLILIALSTFAYKIVLKAGAA